MRAYEAQLDPGLYRAVVNAPASAPEYNPQYGQPAYAFEVEPAVTARIETPITRQASGSVPPGGTFSPVAAVLSAAQAAGASETR